MNPNMTALEALAEELNRRNYSCDVVDSRIALPQLSLEVHARDAKLRDRPKGLAASVIYDARAEGMQSEGITILSVGFGPTETVAFGNAADQWIRGVLPVLLSYLTPEHDCELARTEMVVGVEGSQERYGWQVYLGPVLPRLFATSDDSQHVETADVYDIYWALFNAVSAHAAHRTVFWIEAFGAYYPDGRIDATCRLRNDDWSEGRDALLEWIAKWSAHAGGLVTQRQFLLFRPVAVEDMNSGERLAQHLEQRLSQD